MPMTELEVDADRRQALAALQLLVDPAILLIIGQLLQRDLTREEIQHLAPKQAKPGRGPLAQLRLAGLVQVGRDDEREIWRIDRERLATLKGAVQRLSRDLLADRREPNAADAVNGLSEEERRLLAACFRGDQIVDLPPSNSPRMVLLLEWLAERFAMATRYPERDVNAIITRHHPDFATLRRHLVDYGLMRREREIYWRVENP